MSLISIRVAPSDSIESVLDQYPDQGRFTFEMPEGICWVSRLDLSKMESMKLGHLPVDAIGIPEGASLGLGDDIQLQNTEDISRQLSRFFPNYFVVALYEMQQILNKGEFRAYVIGGITRDILLYQERRLEIQDVDITVQGDAIECARYLSTHSKNFILDREFPEFGTAKLHYKDSLSFDLASTRCEMYAHCGALPDVMQRGVPLETDIVRRDFTVNALALSVNEPGKILDYVDGIGDIERKLIRVLHPVSFFEDPSRILRAFKFLSRMDFSLDIASQRLLDKFLHYGKEVYPGGGERIRYELTSLLTLEETSIKQNWLGYFIEHDALKLINMKLPPWDAPLLAEKKRALLALETALQTLKEMLDEKNRDTEILQMFLCFLLEDLDQETLYETAHRLHLPRADREAIECYLEMKQQKLLSGIQEFSSPGEVYEIFHTRPMSALLAGIIDVGLTNKEQARSVLEALKTYRRKWAHIKPELKGSDLIELGVPPSEQIGQVLKKLHHVKLTGRLPDRLSEIKYLQQLLEGKEEPVTEEMPENDYIPE